LGQVIEQASGQTFGELLMKNIVDPLQLKNTVPSISDSLNFNLITYNKDSFLPAIAKPYNWAGKEFHPVEFSYGFGPAARIMSSVGDLATYSVAIDENKFFKAQTWEQTFTPYVTPKGKRLQYGLGWFVKYYNGVKIVRHTRCQVVVGLFVVAGKNSGERPDLYYPG
jgi:CubicO group peptidase (beta-lactamase class C family)